MIRDGLRRHDATKDYVLHKTIHNCFTCWGRLGVFNRIFAVLAALDAIELGHLLEHPAADFNPKHQAGYGLLRIARQQLRAVDGMETYNYGYEMFAGMLAAHGLDLFAD